jgi:hypothetical protein
VDDRRTLRGLVSSCELIESNWRGVEAICDSPPRTLVHGDLCPKPKKNLRFRHDDAGPAIVSFDWEFPGWGIPPADANLLVSAMTGSGGVPRVGEDGARTRRARPSVPNRSALSEYAHPLTTCPQPQSGMAKLCRYGQPLREWGEGPAAATT